MTWGAGFGHRPGDAIMPQPPRAEGNKIPDSQDSTVLIAGLPRGKKVVWEGL